MVRSPREMASAKWRRGPGRPRQSPQGWPGQNFRWPAAGVGDQRRTQRYCPAGRGLRGTLLPDEGAPA
eukprot:10791027-Heterocapsa_arctica.AAC.1